ncbi:DUF7007 domain-containing protein [Sphingomonas oryzagri]
MTEVTIEYGTTADGLIAARIGDIAYVALPVDGGFSLASGWRLSRPIAQWSSADVYGSEGRVPDQAAFHAHVEDVATHLRQRAALGRKGMESRISTPWGVSQSATFYAEGVVCHSTARHGGFKLDRTRNAGLHPALRIAGGWYEEDADWARVAIGYPDLFTDRKKRHAARTVKDWLPDAWDAIYGGTLTPEESFTRDRQRFEREHVDDWVVISAIRSDRFSGYVETVATVGGTREEAERRFFLVPGEEYHIGRHGFVIDPDRHRQFAAA